MNYYTNNKILVETKYKNIIFNTFEEVQNYLKTDNNFVWRISFIDINGINRLFRKDPLQYNYFLELIITECGEYKIINKNIIL